MKDGTVLLCNAEGSPDLAAKLIHFFTGSWYAHAGIVYADRLYEAVWYTNQRGEVINGVRVTTPYNVEQWEPIRDLSPGEKAALGSHLATSVGRPYNLFRFLQLAIVYPTRWFWKWIKWVPFADKILGVVCSQFVDEAYKAIGIDLLPGESEWYTVPGDLARSPMLRRV